MFGFAAPLPPRPINYVISAHGAMNGGHFSLPVGFAVQYYVNPGETLYCTRHKQTQVCAGTAETRAEWRHTGVIADYTLTPDEYNPRNRNSFLSGIKDCNRNEIVYNLTGQAEGITLRRCIDIINTHHQYYHRNIFGRILPAVIHLLFCRDVASNSDEMVNVTTGLPASVAYLGRQGGKRASRRQKRKISRKTRRLVSKP